MLKPQPQARSVFQRRMAVTALALLTATLHGLPWLIDGIPWVGLLAVTMTLWLAALTSHAPDPACASLRERFVSRSSLVALILWTIWGTVAIGIAFHWAPNSMAYTLSSGFGLGLAVSAPLILWDGWRLGMMYWFASRVTTDARMIWLPTALSAVVIESWIPSVFPWRLGFMLLPWHWIYQPVDIFGAGWTSLMLFAHAGLVIWLITALTSPLRRPPGTQLQGDTTGTPSMISGDATAEITANASSTAPNTNNLARHPTTRGLTWNMATCIGLVLFNLAYGGLSIQSWNSRIDQAPKLSLAVIQVDPSNVTSLAELQKWTLDTAPQVDLVCWPESSGGNYEMQLSDLRDRDIVFQQSREPERGLQPWRQPSCELLLAGKNYRGDAEQPEELHVTAMLMDTNECIAARYHKRFLMPFGEYVPGEDWVPGLAALFDMAEHINPGGDAQPLVSQTGAHIGPMLCFEDMVPKAAIDMTRSGANILISLINGSAFESPYTLQQHRMLSQLRALECRKAFVRCAATGQSCVISPLGIISNQLPLQQSGATIATVPLVPGQTLFTQLPWLGTLLATLAWLAICWSLSRSPSTKTNSR